MSRIPYLGAVEYYSLQSEDGETNQRLEEFLESQGLTFESLKPWLLPQSTEKWTDRSNKMSANRRIFESQISGSIRANKIVQYILTTGNNKYFKKEVEGSQDRTDPDKARISTFTLADILSQLVLEFNLDTLRSILKDLGKDYNIIFDGEEQAGLLTDVLAQPYLGSQAPKKTIYGDPVDGTDQLNNPSGSRFFGIAHSCPSLDIHTLYLPEMGRGGTFFGADGEGDSYVVEDFEGEQVRINFETQKAPSSNLIVVNSRVPDNLKQKFTGLGINVQPEREYVDSEGRVGVNSALVAFAKGKTDCYAELGKNPRDIAGLNVLATMTTHFESYRTVIDGQELLVVVNKKSPKYQEIIQGLRDLYPQSGLVDQVKDLRNDL